MVYDENRSPLYDYCAVKKSGDDRFYLKADAKYLITRAALQQVGSISAVFNVNFFETEQNQLTTTKPGMSDSILPKGKGNKNNLSLLILKDDFFYHLFRMWCSKIKSEVH